MFHLLFCASQLLQHLIEKMKKVPAVLTQIPNSVIVTRFLANDSNFQGHLMSRLPDAAAKTDFLFKIKKAFSELLSNNF